MLQGKHFPQGGPNAFIVGLWQWGLINHQSYFKEHLLPRIKTPMDENADAHVLFNLMMANDGQLPMNTYIESDINIWGLKGPNVGFLILGEPNRVLERKHHTKLPGIK